MMRSLPEQHQDDAGSSPLATASSPQQHSRCQSAGPHDDASTHEAAAGCAGDLHRLTVGVVTVDLDLRGVVFPYEIPSPVRLVRSRPEGFRFQSGARSAGSC